MAPNPLALLTACLPCLPQSGARKQQQALNGSHRADYYNTQLRSNLGMPERPLRLPIMVADHSDQQPQAPQQGADLNFTNQQGYQQQRPAVSEPTRATGSSASRPTANPRGRFPTAPSGGAGTSRGAKAKVYSDTPMETAQVTELFDKLATIDFIPYAICGRGALVDYGLSARKAKQVSIMVPAYSKDVVAGWAKSSGWVSTMSNTTNGTAAGAAGGSNGGKATIFIGIPLSDGSVRQLRIKYLDEEQFECLERVRARLSPNAWVLSLTSQLDHLAAAWLDHHKQADEKKAKAEAQGNGSSAAATKHEKPLREIGRDIMWTLDRMAETRLPGTAGPDPRLLQTLSSEAFFVPFSDQYAEARPEMARAGIDVGVILVGLRERRALREHNAMLAEYGAAPVGRQSAALDALPFAGIRDLNHSKSVYTIATNISATELGLNGPLPKTPMTPKTPMPPKAPKALKAPEPSRGLSSGAAALLDRITTIPRRSSDGGSRVSSRRSRSVRVSGGRPSISGPIIDGDGDGGRNNLTRSASTRAPPRTLAIPHADESGRRSSDQWI